MSKRRGASYQKRVTDINRIYDQHAKSGISNREIWRRYVYPVYGICERTFYNLLNASCDPTLTMNQDIQKIIRNILNDVRVELSDEFDRNFERQAFFNEAWQRRSSPTRPGGSILIDTGKLRQSISSRTTDSSITFCSTLPYAAIHNEGGEIKVTARMKRFFWYKYHEATGSFGRKKNGERRNDKRTVQLSTEAEFWKHMALMKEGKSIKIPRRRFLGASPEVEQAVKDIIEENLAEYFEHEYKLK